MGDVRIVEYRNHISYHR